MRSQRSRLNQRSQCEDDQTVVDENSLPPSDFNSFIFLSLTPPSPPPPPSPPSPSTTPPRPPHPPSLSTTVQSLMPLRQRTGDPAPTFSSQRLVEGPGLPQENGRGLLTTARPPSGRQCRSRSIGQLEFLPVLAPPTVSPSLSHPSIGPSFSFTPPPPPPPATSSSPPLFSSYTEGTAHVSALLLRSSCFHSMEASSSFSPAEGAVSRRKQRCRSGSFGYFFF